MTRGWALWPSLPWAFRYLRPYRRLAAVSVSLTTATALVFLAQPWPLAIVVDSVLGSQPLPGILDELLSGLGRWSLLGVLVAAGFALTVLGNALQVANSFLDARIEQSMVLDLRGDLFDHCQRLSLTFHDGRKTGELMSRINYKAAAVGAIVLAIPPVAQSALTLVGMFVIAALIDLQVALVSLAVVPLLSYSLGLYGTRIVPRLQRVQALEWESLSIVHEAMAMLRVIVTFGRERHEFRRFRTQGETAVDERVKLTVRQTLFTLGVNTATAAGTAIVFGLGAYHVAEGKLSVGELLVLLSYIAAVYQPLESISGTIGHLNDQLVQLRSSIDLLELDPEVKEAPGAVSIERAAGEVAFEEVGFSYPKRSNVLKDVSFTVPAGSRVALVGPTGAGKTTLVSLLARLYDPQDGRITIDGVDIRTLRLRSLRDQISIVLQEPMLFSGTIADNIRYGKLDASMEEIVAAAKAANAHDFIARLPRAYETPVGERGAGLSGGERQRICIARAFIKDAPILVLDEPTSSIDSKTEEVILDALENLIVGRTTFMIAHRLSTVRDADVILVMSHGRVVDLGTHDELVEREGVYRQLHEAQSRRRRPRAAAGSSR